MGFGCATAALAAGVATGVGADEAATAGLDIGEVPTGRLTTGELATGVGELAAG
jgi:hypothetical protein